MKDQIILKEIIGLGKLKKLLKKVVFRGIYDSRGNNIYSYENVKFKICTLYPQSNNNILPEIVVGKTKKQIFTPQPTIYQNQIDIIERVDKFLKTEKIDISRLENAVNYDWPGRGEFHMLPPIIEKHTYYLKNGYIDLEELCNRFRGKYVKDARGNLHCLKNRYLKSFYIDEVSSIKHLDIFNSNAPIINYGLNQNGRHDFHIICDGAHRIDYVIEKLNKPISVLLAEPKKGSLLPYYAFPVPFRPTIRLSSKRSEKMYHRLERDKIHLFNDFIKKTLHYDWAGLKVSKLRSNAEIY